MVSYGSDTTVQELVWGAARSSVPASVIAARTVATAIINSALGLNKDLDAAKVPAALTTIANLMAAGIIQEQRKPEAKSQNTFKAEKLLEEYEGQGTEILGEWGHTSFVDTFL